MTKPQREREDVVSHKDLPYDEITEAHYAQYAAATWSAEAGDGVIVLQGLCPRCSGSSEYLVADGIYRRAVGMADRGNGPGSEAANLICCCAGNHAGRPEGGEGCGAYWNLNLSPNFE